MIGCPWLAPQAFLEKYDISLSALAADVFCILTFGHPRVNQQSVLTRWKFVAPRVPSTTPAQEPSPIRWVDAGAHPRWQGGRATCRPRLNRQHLVGRSFPCGALARTHGAHQTGRKVIRNSLVYPARRRTPSPPSRPGSLGPDRLDCKPPAGVQTTSISTRKGATHSDRAKLRGLREQHTTGTGKFALRHLQSPPTKN